MTPQRDIMELFYIKGKPTGKTLHIYDMLNAVRFGEYMVIASAKMLAHHGYLRDMGKGYYKTTRMGNKAMKKGWL